MTLLERILLSLARFQIRYKHQILLVLGVITLFMVFGVARVEIESDIQEEMPQDLPIYQFNDRVNAKFGGQDTIFILFSLDSDNDLKSRIKDIRHPVVISYMDMLQQELIREISIEQVFSVVSTLPTTEFATQEALQETLAQIPGTDGFFSKDYRRSLMYLTVDVGTGEKKINELTTMINKKIEDLSTPPGVEITLTGTPQIQMTIFDLLARDAVFTLLLAIAIVFVLLTILEYSVKKAVLIVTPLLLGITWTMGTLGWLGIKLSVATVGIGAMIVGLGVEYGVFMYTRYKEERDKKQNQNNSIKRAVPAVGSAIVGSGMTTIVGFLALTLSIMPMLQHLGQSLALGIFFCLFGAVVVEPLFIIVEEDIEYWYLHRSHRKVQHRIKHHTKSKEEGG
jgi:hydrophobe/amphiphile efflux-3 (HAE3) family protein